MNLNKSVLNTTNSKYGIKKSGRNYYFKKQYRDYRLFRYNCTKLGCYQWKVKLFYKKLLILNTYFRKVLYTKVAQNYKRICKLKKKQWKRFIQTKVVKTALTSHLSFLYFLDFRVDCMLYRLRLVSSISQAQRIIAQGYINLNFKKVTSYNRYIAIGSVLQFNYICILSKGWSIALKRSTKWRFRVSYKVKNYFKFTSVFRSLHGGLVELKLSIQTVVFLKNVFLKKRAVSSVKFFDKRPIINNGVKIFRHLKYRDINLVYANYKLLYDHKYFF